MAIEVTWRGASHNPHVFTLYPIGTEFRSVGGLYIFCRKVTPTDWQALYVGETESFKGRLSDRLSNHAGYGRASYLGATHVGVKVMENFRQRLSAETDLRHGLRPRANMQGIGVV